MPKIPVASTHVEEPVGVPEAEERQVLYDAVFSVHHQREDRPRRKGCLYEPPLDVGTMKDMLGWQEEPDGSGVEAATGFYGDDYLFKDMNGKKVRCVNNPGNRPYDHRWSIELAHNIIRRQWRYNGESMVIGKTGRVLSCQHRLIGACLAEQMRTGAEAGRWEEVWPNDEGITLECVVVYGVDEDTDTTRTHDNVKPRSLSDVLYADTNLFGEVHPRERAALTRVMSSALRQLRYRTGAMARSQDRRLGFFPKRTHGTYIEFVQRHPRLKAAVRHLNEENKNGTPLKPIIDQGEAAALLYLMGSCKTEPTDYHNARRLGEENEGYLDFSMWDRAKLFWSHLCDNKSTPRPLSEVHHALGALVSVDGETRGTPEERKGILVNAWCKFVDGTPFTQKDIKLGYGTTDEGLRRMLTTPVVGGIDTGGVNDEAADDVAAGTVDMQPVGSGMVQDEPDPDGDQVAHDALMAASAPQSEWHGDDGPGDDEDAVARQAIEASSTQLPAYDPDGELTLADLPSEPADTEPDAPGNGAGEGGKMVQLSDAVMKRIDAEVQKVPVEDRVRIRMELIEHAQAEAAKKSGATTVKAARERQRKARQAQQLAAAPAEPAPAPAKPLPAARASRKK